MREPIKDFYGKVLGWREDKGNRIVASDFYVSVRLNQPRRVQLIQPIAVH